jgi:hypothetical protein
MPANNNGSSLKNKEQQNKMQSTLDKSKNSMKNLEGSFAELKGVLDELNKNTKVLNIIEGLQLANDRVSNKDSIDRTDKQTRELVDTDKDSAKFMVEQNARNEAGLRAIRDSIIRFHSDFVGESKLQQADRLKIASKEHNDGIKKHRSVGMAQMDFLEKFNITSVSGLDKNGSYTNSKTGETLTRKELLKLWDETTKKKSHERDISVLKAIFKDAKFDKDNNLIEGDDPRTKHLLDTMEKIIPSNKNAMIDFMKITRDNNLSDDQRQVAMADLYMKHVQVQQTLIGKLPNKHESTKAEETQVDQGKKTVMLLEDLRDQGKEDKLARKEEARENRRIMLRASGKRGGRGGNRVIPKSVVPGSTGGVARAFLDVGTAAYATKKAADALIKKKAADKVAKKALEVAAKKKVADKVAAEAAKKVAAEATKKSAAIATEKKVAEVATKKLVVETTKKKTVVAAAKKAALKSSGGSFMKLFSLASRLAAKMGWKKLAGMIAMRMPLLAGSVLGGPLITAALLVYSAYDIYQVLQEIDKLENSGSSVMDSTNAKPDLLSPNNTFIGAQTQSQADAIERVTKLRTQALQPSSDPDINLFGKDKAPGVINSGNTSNSGNIINNINYGGIDSTLSGRVPTEGMITPGY